MEWIRWVSADKGTRWHVRRAPAGPDYLHHVVEREKDAKFGGDGLGLPLSRLG
jgi:hypothetical protein